jgi:LruC domain-containing protein
MKKATHFATVSGKLLGLMILMIIMIGTGCKKLDPQPSGDEQKTMEDLNVPASFDWNTVHDVYFVISYDLSCMINISSEDGSQVFHFGFFNHTTDTYNITLSIPTYLQTVLVNGIPTDVTGNTANVDLNTFKSTPANQQQNTPHQPQVPTDGLIATWHFNEGSGTTATDATGSNNGTIAGATWTDGISGDALNFNGTGGCVTIPNNSTINLTNDQLTLSCWFKKNQTNDDGAFFFHNVKYILRMDQNGKISFAVYNPSWSSLTIAWSQRIIDTDWHHVAATYDGSVMKIYLDGAHMASNNTSGNLQSSNADLKIGSQTSSNQFGGIIDEVLLYNTALTEPEIAVIYGQTPDPGTGGDPISSWPLNEGSGTIAYDIQDGNDGTINGATWGTGISGSCLEFDGTDDWVYIPKDPNMNVTDQITIIAWAKTLENKTCKIAQKGDWDGHGLTQGKWGGWYGGIRLATNESESIGWEEGIPLFDTWYQLAVTYDGSMLKLYVNGQLKNSKAVSGPLKINNRDFSIGSDNGAQKFFNGSIDQVSFYGTALSQTAIQTLYNNAGSTPDADGDGIPDAEDAYPSDPARAFNNYLPANAYGSLAFEDLWPGTGDYDFNDLVLDYRFQTVTSASNKVTEVMGTFIIRAIGAGLQNGFGYQLPVSIPDADITISGYDLRENYITLAANGTESGQTNTTVIVFDNVSAIMPSTSGFGVNVDPGLPFVTPDTTVVTMAFTPETYTIEQLGLTSFNPFLIVNMERGKEVHLPDYAPTSLVDLAYFGTAQDASDPALGVWYKTATNLPWAINISTSFDYTIERNQITTGYLHFGTWAESGGLAYSDWYLDETGYRNSAAIYQAP